MVSVECKGQLWTGLREDAGILTPNSLCSWALQDRRLGTGGV